jgi:hypothetical protein
VHRHKVVFLFNNPYYPHYFSIIRASWEHNKTLIIMDITQRSKSGIMPGFKLAELIPNGITAIPGPAKEVHISQMLLLF